MSETSAKLLPFLIELRQRLLLSLLVLVVVFCGLMYFANDFFTWLASPLLKQLPQGHSLIATQIVAPFFVPVELTFVVSMLVIVPFFLYQAWQFVAPALYRHERRALWPLILISTMLFYLGVAFAYFVIFPLIFSYLARSVPAGVTLSPDIGSYLDFCLKLLLTFGLVFEVPIITIVTISLGITTRETLIRARPYVIVGAFIVGMLIAPPDVLSQTVLALPLWFLFETGLFFARFFVREKVRRGQEMV